MAGPLSWLDGPKEGTDKPTNIWVENLPILRDYVPYQLPKKEVTNGPIDEPTDKWMTGHTLL